MSEEIGSTLQAWPWPVATEVRVKSLLDLTPEPLLDALRAQFDSYELSSAGVAYSEEHGCYVFEWQGVWNYGLVGNCDDLLDVFRESGIAYVVECDAKYEWEAEVQWWHPGMSKESREQGSQDSGIVLTRSRFAEIVEQYAADVNVYDVDFDGTVQCQISAATTLEALDLYSTRAGYSKYSDLPVEPGDTPWHWQNEDGSTSAVYENGTLTAREAGITGAVRAFFRTNPWGWRPTP